MTLPSFLFSAIPICIFAPLVVFAAVRDAVSYIIPNWVSAALAVTFLPAALILHHGWDSQITNALILGVVLLSVGMGMFALNWMGGGDAKLMAASSLWIGYSHGLPLFVLFTGLAGGVLALGLITVRSAFVRPFAAAGPAWVGRLATPGAAAPYGVAIAIGALAAFPQGLIMHAATGGF